jgi:hypothetical protein
MARKVIVKEYDCNRCGRKGCRGDVIRDGKGGIKTHLTCPGMMTPTPMKQTLLEAASANPESFGNALNGICSSMNLRFDEIPRYPYFRFVFFDTDEEMITNV